MFSEEYFVYMNKEFKKYSLRDLAKNLLEYNDDKDNKVWSARLSTGLFGSTSCKSGNRGPKSYNEVILAVGNEGLNKFIELGFITCPSCHPENTQGFWKTIDYSAYKRYGINKIEEFIDKKVLPFDASRISWEKILPIIEATPNRIYLPRDLTTEDIAVFQKRFSDMSFRLPQIGYYNQDAPGRFTEYKVSQI